MALAVSREARYVGVCSCPVQAFLNDDKASVHRLLVGGEGFHPVCQFLLRLNHGLGEVFDGVGDFVHILPDLGVGIHLFLPHGSEPFDGEFPAEEQDEAKADDYGDECEV